MDLAQILDRFDHERRTLSHPGLVREEAGSLVRHISRHSTQSAILYSAHEPGELDAAVAREIAYFQSIGHDFEWKVYAHDRPPDLAERLGAAGFARGETEVVLVAEPAAVLAELPEAPFAVERLGDPDGLDDYQAVCAEVWGGGSSGRVAATLRNAPEALGVYVAYCDGAPVGSARCTFDGQSMFSGLWGGGVIPEYRHRGVYRALIRRRAQDALDFGARYLQVDARATSRPILERLGFQRLAETTPCQWNRRQ